MHVSLHVRIVKKKKTKKKTKKKRVNPLKWVRVLKPVPENNNALPLLFSERLNKLYYPVTLHVNDSSQIPSTVRSETSEAPSRR